jgi:hypothetical protein
MVTWPQSAWAEAFSDINAAVTAPARDTRNLMRLFLLMTTGQ